MKSKKAVSSKSSLCNKIITTKNKTIRSACQKVENKLRDKSFRRKLMIGAVIFLLFNLVIILMLAKKTIAYKLTKYFAKKILEGADPKEKEMIVQIQKNLPIVVEFVKNHGGTIKEANTQYSYYSNMYNDFVKVIAEPAEGKDYIMPGGFSSSPEASKEEIPLPDKKLDETQAKKLIDNLVDDVSKKDISFFSIFPFNLY